MVVKEVWIESAVNVDGLEVFRGKVPARVSADMSDEVLANVVRQALLKVVPGVALRDPRALREKIAKAKAP